MLESLSIKGFRKYKDFRIDGLGQVNFILGDNNVGKTSFLEAVYTWACGQNVAPLYTIPLARARYTNYQNPYWVMEELLASVYDRKTIPLEMVFDGNYSGERVCFEHSIFPSELLGEYDTSYRNSSSLVGIRSNGITPRESQQLLSGLSGILQMTQTSIARWDIKRQDSIVSTDLTVPASTVSEVRSFCPALFVDLLSHTVNAEIVKVYGALKREQLMDATTREIRKIFPEIVGFDLLPYPDGSQSPISVIKKDRTLPLYACGDGIQRWFYLLGAMTLYKRSIICIDEVDTGLHYEAQAEFAKNLVSRAIGNGVQLFATTHNIEFLDNFLRAMENNNEDDVVRIITLRETSEGLKTRVMSAKEAYRNRSSYNLELR